jgi:hypothetical protein
MNYISILTLNVEGYNRLRYTNVDNDLDIDIESRDLIFHNLINKLDPDLLLLQEDITDIYPIKNWTRVSMCESHYSNIIDKKYSNSILIRSDNIKNISNSYSKMLTTTNEFPKRCSSSILYRSRISITNVHLSGGKFDDKKYQLANKINLRNNQINEVIGSDIIAGDFNSNPSEEFFPVSHPVYKSLETDLERQAFRHYFVSGHKPLFDAGYIPVPINTNTDIFGGNPDAVYYNPDRLELLDVKVIEFLPDLTDHNGIYCKFYIKNNNA